MERTDSGVGGDMGQSPLRRSWEEIVMKSSEHWSVVAASARHWQELARRRKANEDETTSARKRSSVHSITEDMVLILLTTNRLTLSFSLETNGSYQLIFNHKSEEKKQHLYYPFVVFNVSRSNAQIV